MNLKKFKYIYESICPLCGAHAKIIVFDEQRHFCQSCNRFFQLSDRRTKWDTLRKKFFAWHCLLHNFDPNETTLSTKCFNQECMHLVHQARNEVIVSNIQEAMRIKSDHDEIVIEQKKDGFLLKHK